MQQTSTPVENADNRLDITRDHCPMTYVRVRLALDRMSTGQVLLVSLAGDEPNRNVPLTAREQGHTILAHEAGPGRISQLWIRKG